LLGHFLPSPLLVVHHHLAPSPVVVMAFLFSLLFKGQVVPNVPGIHHRDHLRNRAIFEKIIIIIIIIIIITITLK
jgi:hypothetical protein